MPASTFVSAGQTSSGIVLNNRSTETVLAGGTSSQTTINSGGSETVSAGGYDVSATLNFGGGQTVYGTAISPIINSGSEENVLSAGTVSGAITLPTSAASGNQAIRYAQVASMIAAIKSVVATGRRMKMREGFISRP